MESNNTTPDLVNIPIEVRDFGLVPKQKRLTGNALLIFDLPSGPVYSLLGVMCGYDDAYVIEHGYPFDKNCRALPGLRAFLQKALVERGAEIAELVRRAAQQPI